MVNLRIPRTATFAWSPGNHLPLLATGTVAGAVDADFSNATHLEIWDLNLESGTSEGAELKPTATVNTDSRFYDIAWGVASSDKPRGIIAGGLENGSLDLWSADALISGEGEALLSQTTKHTGPIKTLQFNPFKPELLLTAGVKGEIFVWDTNNLANPFLLGNRAQRSDDFSSVDWNKKIPHILLSGGKNGLVTVWDVKQKKESLTLSHLGKKEVSAVAWHPDNATKLLTAMPDDLNPVVMVWDLRNANAPERILSGHDQGVLSLAWCKQDTDLLLSSGKDNRTICWNPNNGEILGEFPIGTNWTFQTKFNPRNPDIMASASFDGKISIQSLQNAPAQKGIDTGFAAMDGEDFFAKASFDPQGPAFSLKNPPKWYRCPVGASFGFGGKLVSFTAPLNSTPGQPVHSTVKITKYAVESEVSESTEMFEQALKGGNLSTLCDSRIDEASSSEDKEQWQLLKTLFEPKTKAKIIEFLGFNANTEEDDLVGELASTKLEDDTPKDGGLAPSSAETNGFKKGHSKRLSQFFAEGSAESDSFLSELASLPSTRGARTNNPFSIYSGSETDADKKITKALLLGDFERAVDVCIAEDRISDAFMLAVCGGDKCVEKVQTAYFTKKAKGPNYLRVLASIVGKNLWDVVHNADLSNWKEVLVALCTFAEDAEFNDLCDALGERLQEELKTGANNETRKDAALCYLAGSKLEKVVSIWIEEYQENEKTGLENASRDTSSFAVHVRSLQQLIEKVTVFREATKFVDKDLQSSGPFKLEALYEKYCEYADVVASHGHLEVAEKYLNLVPFQYPPAEVARNRVKQATGKVAAPAPTTAKKTLPVQPHGSLRQNTRSPYPAPLTTPAANTYAPSNTQPSNPYAPKNIQPANPYAPTSQPAPVAPTMYAPPAGTNNYTPIATGYQTNPPQTNHGSGGYQPPTFNSYQPQAGGGYTAPPPPRSSFGAPLVPGPLPAAKRTDITPWNDTPLVEPRKKTPAIPHQQTGPITTPFPIANPMASPIMPGAPPYGGGPPPRGSTPGLPPPPKNAGGPLPRGMSPANVPNSYAPQTPTNQNAPQNPYAPRSPPTNQYAPQTNQYTPQSNQFATPPVSTPAPSGRYTPQAPPAGQQQQPGLGQRGPGFAPPPPGGQYAPRQAPQGPPSNPYAPQGQTQQQYDAPGQFTRPPPHVPQQGPPPMSAPPPSLGGPSSITSRPSTQGSVSASKSATPAPKHPAGDRRHIPVVAQPIFEYLSADMARVSAQAPLSFAKQVKDTVKRVNILFDHLNNEELLTPPTIELMADLARALESKDYQTASDIQQDIHKNKGDECSQWMVGVKRLIEMSRATP